MPQHNVHNSARRRGYQVLQRASGRCNRDQVLRCRQDWLDERAEGIKLLALKIEKPSGGTQGASAGVDNTSRSRDTMLLEACLRFQATAGGELLPTGGPVKVESKLSRDTLEGDTLAQLLEDDFNYY